MRVHLQSKIVIRWKTFAARHQSCIAKAYCTGYFFEKNSRLPINPQKTWKFSTVNDLQYTVVHSTDIKVRRCDTKHRFTAFSLADWLIAKDTFTMSP